MLPFQPFLLSESLAACYLCTLLQGAHFANFIRFNASDDTFKYPKAVFDIWRMNGVAGGAS